MLGGTLAMMRLLVAAWLDVAFVAAAPFSLLKGRYQMCGDTANSGGWQSTVYRVAGRNWNELPRGLTMDIDTSACGYATRFTGAAPRYFATVIQVATGAGAAAFTSLTVSSIVFDATPTSFRVFVYDGVTQNGASAANSSAHRHSADGSGKDDARSAAAVARMLAAARSSWALSWAATVSTASGQSAPTAWRPDPDRPGGIFADVDARAAGFAHTPRFVVALAVGTPAARTLAPATGANAVYRATAKGFRIYLHLPPTARNTTGNSAAAKGSTAAGVRSAAELEAAVRSERDRQWPLGLTAAAATAAGWRVSWVASTDSYCVRGGGDASADGRCVRAGCELRPPSPSHLYSCVSSPPPHPSSLGNPLASASLCLALSRAPTAARPPPLPLPTRPLWYELDAR